MRIAFQFLLLCYWNNVIRRLFNYKRWQSVKDLSLGLGRLKITHLRKIDFIGTLP